MKVRSPARILGLVAAVVGSVSAFVGPAWADKGARETTGNGPCFDAALEGQKLRNAGHLLAAKKPLIECAASSCPREVSQDCSRWLSEVNAAIPSMVFGLRDAAGADVVGASVFVDGEPVGTSSDGAAIAVDPGPHAVRFVREGASSVERTFVARAGEKNRALLVQLEAAPPPARQDARERQERGDGAWAPTATWVLGGVSIVALGVFTYFGATGLGDHAEFHCDVGCAKDDKDRVDTKFLIADVSLAVSVVALAGAAYFYFARERRIWK
jgi:hypothetical protein